MGAAEVGGAGAEGWVGGKINSGEGEVVDEFCAGGGGGAGEGGAVDDANKCGWVASSNVVRVEDGQGSGDDAYQVRW